MTPENEEKVKFNCRCRGFMVMQKDFGEEKERKKRRLVRRRENRNKLLRFFDKGKGPELAWGGVYTSEECCREGMPRSNVRTRRDSM